LPLNVFDLDGGIVTNIPTAKAKPPIVIRLMVSPTKYKAISEHMMDSGIDTAMIQVVRQLPRNSKIIAAVRPAAINASCSTLPIAALTNSD
jgi:hypothetical protein